MQTNQTKKLKRLNLTLWFLAIVTMVTIGFIPFIFLKVSESKQKLIKENTLQQAQKTAQALKTIRKRYTTDVVDRAKNLGKMQITHDFSNPGYDTTGGAIPLPATLSMSIAKDMSDSITSVKLYSKYPFPWRKNRKISAFEIKAFESFEKNQLSNAPYYKFDEEKQQLSYAIPDKLVVQACVNCHNNHPQTPKKGWKLNDVRGAISITMPLRGNQTIQQGNTETFLLFITLLSIIALIILVVGLLLRTLITNNKSLKKAIGGINTNIDSLKTGKLPDNIEASDTEVALIAEGLNNFVDRMKTVTRFAKETGENNFETTFTPKSEHDTLAKALIDMRARLKAYAEDMENKVQEITAELNESIEELKAIQVLLQIAKQEAEAANVSKSHFLANMSHEIRSPLNAISGFSQILVNKAKKLNLSPEFIQFLDNINLSSQNLSELINNILDLSKIAAGKMDISDEPLNLKQVFQGIYHINKVNAVKKGLNFSYIFDDKLPKTVETDRTKVNQILMNLTTNAIKFTPENKKVTLKASRDHEFIIFQVIDEGIGISKDRLNLMFDSFEQADNSITRRFGGTGLGLAISKQMTEMLGGTISVESEEGKGSIFTVMIPLRETKEQPTQQPQEHLDDYHFSKHNMVLIIEDNELNQEVFSAIFGELGLEIKIAENGKAGIEKMIKFKPDLILMDMHMPVMDGLEAILKKGIS